MCKTETIQGAKDRNLTVRLPIHLLRQLKKESAAEGISMNAYLERMLAKTLTGSQNEVQRTAAMRLLSRARAGLYKMDRPLTREEAHDRHA